MREVAWKPLEPKTGQPTTRLHLQRTGERRTVCGLRVPEWAVCEPQAGECKACLSLVLREDEAKARWAGQSVEVGT